MSEHDELISRQAQHLTAASDHFSSPSVIEPLTEREREVLLLIADGASNREIGERLVITVGTVKRHINNLFGKLGVQSRTQAIRIARDRDLLS